MKKITIFILPLFLSLVSLVLASGICIPVDCPNDYVPNLKCSSAKLLNPALDCCENKCRDDGNAVRNSGGSVIDPANVQQPQIEGFLQFDIFGSQIKINPERLPALFLTVISSIMFGISIYVLVKGIYVAGVKRTQAVSPEEIAKINKQFTGLVVGFVLLWSFIFIMQVVFSFLGLGNITSLDFSQSEGSNIVIR